MDFGLGFGCFLQAHPALKSVLVLNVADLLVASFIFLLFVSIYRKRSKPAVRFWVIGWGSVLLHFAAQAMHPSSETGQTVQSIVSLSMLVFCGTAFALSYPASHASGRRQRWIGISLGVPWLLSMIFGSLSARWFLWAAVAALLSALAVAGVAIRLFRTRRLRLAAIAFLVGGCLFWLASTLRTRDLDAVVCIVLTMCFGFIAVLLGGRKPWFSAASMTTTCGAFSWSLVWVCATVLARWKPGLAVSPEIWNLPKYLLAAGMVLSLLEEEIRSAALASAEYRLLFAGSPHPMWIYDPETLKFLDVNDAAVAHYGYSRAEFTGLTLPDVMEVGHDETALEEVRATEPQKLSGPWLHRRKDGTEFQADMASQPMEREGARATFALIHDVTEPLRLHAQLMRQAHHDVLTDLPNRALFEQRLHNTLQRAATERHLAAIFCIDLDRFKQINDTYGHAAGDSCLREMVRRINVQLAGKGTLARTGGDEFMLLVGDLRSPEEAEGIADGLIACLRQSVALERGEVELATSIGITVYPDDGADAAQLWRDSDAAMYRAKRAGGSKWVRVSQEISAAVSEANEIEFALRRALKSGDFEMYYQPQMDMQGGLHSLEALLRSRDPLLSQTPTGRYIAIAEESGLIVPLGDWVLEEACRQSRAWIDGGLRPVQIAVNVSPLQLTRFDFSGKVSNLLERYRLSPRMLEFEVTESTMMPDGGDAPHQIAMLARMGIRFSVDDFGTGYSSLGRLHQLPVDTLKIDCSFISRIGERKGSYPTVRAIIALAHTFGMNVVAEGVETEQQLRMLQSLECDRVQGYLFSRPLAAKAMKDYLEQATQPAAEEEVA